MSKIFLFVSFVSLLFHTTSPGTSFSTRTNRKILLHSYLQNYPSMFHHTVYHINYQTDMVKDVMLH